MSFLKKQDASKFRKLVNDLFGIISQEEISEFVDSLSGIINTYEKAVPKIFISGTPKKTKKEYEKVIKEQLKNLGKNMEKINDKSKSNGKEIENIIKQIKEQIYENSDELKNEDDCKAIINLLNWFAFFPKLSKKIEEIKFGQENDKTKQFRRWLLNELNSMQKKYKLKKLFSYNIENKLKDLSNVIHRKVLS